jgi:cytochrome c553
LKPASRLRWAAGAASLLAAALALPAAALAQAAAPAKAQACAPCHGPLGVSQVPDTPHLAGQPAIYLRRQLEAYRRGERRDERMAIVAKELSEREIDELARWYESIEVTAKPPR